MLSNWKIRIPLSGQGHKIIHEDVVEGDLARRNPIAFPIIDYDLTTSEKEENLDEAENDIHLNDDEIPDTHCGF